MSIIFVTPTLPWVKVSSDATVQSVNASNGAGALDGNSNNIGIQYFHVAVDSANRIFIRLPISYQNDMPNYQWFALDNTVTDYPIGTIDDINCSFTFNGLNCIIHIIVLADNIVYQYTGLYAEPGVGVTTYGWQTITPVGDQPTFSNKF